MNCFVNVFSTIVFLSVDRVTSKIIYQLSILYSQGSFVDLSLDVTRVAQELKSETRNNSYRIIRLF